MASVHEVIEAFRQAPTNVERGTKFEQLMVRYFELDAMLSQQYDKVWPSGARRQCRGLPCGGTVASRSDTPLSVEVTGRDKSGDEVRGAVGFGVGEVELASSDDGAGWS